VVLAHGGGALPQILPRIAHGQKILPTGDQDASSVLTVARQLWCDSLTYDLASLELARQRFDLHHVVLGTDYPLAAREQPAGRVLQEWHDLRRDDGAKQIGHANGMRLITDRCATHERSHSRGRNA
jgi:aminocarboxymuconate-semialdehyde decarboxylase